MMPVRAVPVGGILAALALGLAAGFTGPAAAALTVTGDAAAWQAVLAANARLNGLRGYRMEVRMSGGEIVDVEVVPRKKAERAMMRDLGGGMEVISVGDQARSRIDMPGAPAGWKCRGVSTAIWGNDPASLQAALHGTVEVVRGQDEGIAGSPMRVYVYTIRGSAAGRTGVLKTALYVGAKNGLPRRSVVTNATGVYTIDYYDYGARIQIVLPACGGS